MTDRKKALVGLHNEEFRKVLVEELEYKYQVTAVSGLEAMKKRASENPFDAYLMDVNLGNAGDNPEPLVEIYQLPGVGDRVARGDATLVATSGYGGYLKSARELGLEGVTLMDKSDLGMEFERLFPG
ncbi:MAG: hypothetical protein OXR66_03105 [Candidatus Woesearchaeota archaeon]|nr:hypothetical protein [Candidatus Woesearchaeota archaeon]